MSDQKTLCDFDKKYIKRHFNEISLLVHKPRYLCLKCARAANKKEWLCKPEKIK
jgi:hypothetical protein